MIPHPDACRAHEESDPLGVIPDTHCARPPHVAGSHVSLLGAPIPGDCGLATPTTVIHVRDLAPVPPAGEQDPPRWDLYLGRPMPRHPDARVRKGSGLRNRWRMEDEGDRFVVLAQYAGWLESPAGALALAEVDVRSGGLKGRRLACWCCPVGMIWTAQDPILCHVQLVAAAIDGLDQSELLRQTWVH